MGLYCMIAKSLEKHLANCSSVWEGVRGMFGPPAALARELLSCDLLAKARLARKKRVLWV